MGWGFCGTNATTGEEMGYSVEGKCHHKGCTEVVDHGLAHVCGSMHEGGEHGCGYYFCPNHLTITGGATLCFPCAEQYDAAHPEEEETYIPPGYYFKDDLDGGRLVKKES